MIHTLTRAEDTNPNGACEWTRETIAGHPPIPEAALTPLRDRLCGLDGDQVVRWWNDDGNAWAAVTDLHRADDHDSAVAVATLLRWCQKHGGGDNRRQIIWSIEQP